MKALLATATRYDSVACDANAKRALVCDEENFSFPEECCLQPSNFSSSEERALAPLGLSPPRSFFPQTYAEARIVNSRVIAASRVIAFRMVARAKRLAKFCESLRVLRAKKMLRDARDLKQLSA